MASLASLKSPGSKTAPDTSSDTPPQSPSNSNQAKSSKNTVSTSQKCGSCGCTAIDVDSSRAEAVCTNCGDVLESNLIVADIQFEENAHGGSSAIGQFVSSDVRGGGGMAGVGGGDGMGRKGRGMYGSIMGVGRESREITLRNAMNKIRALGNQLSLRQDRINIAFNFFKMALYRNLTRGRKSTHVIAACVYITCRTEGTSHMLIDFSDILQIDVYELGRTYLRLSQELCINIPAMDPCLYVMRFAHKLEFSDRTHEVSMTALRLVSRMKKDWIHFGRRPSGLCGAALLIAARLHKFNRSVEDVIKVVKVHESTLRKRLTEFGETPASQLTLDEFMNVDLEAMTEEQDPPSFKAARKRDKLRFSQLEEECDVDEEITELQAEIERQLTEGRAKLRGPYAKFAQLESGVVPLSSPSSSTQCSDPESREVENIIEAQTMETISEILKQGGEKVCNKDSELMPPPASAIKKGVISTPGLGLKDTIQEYITPSHHSKKEESSYSMSEEEEEVEEELDLTGINEDEIDGYILSENEVKFKTKMWMEVNAEYLKEKAEKEEQERKEMEEALKEGREVKKRRRDGPKKPKVHLGGNATAIEAIEKIVQKKKISTKINYDVLKSLSLPFETSAKADSSKTGEETFRKQDDESKSNEEASQKPEEIKSSDESPRAKKTKIEEHPLASSEPIIESGPIASVDSQEDIEDLEEELEDVDESQLSVAELLSKHRGEGGFDEEYYGEEEYF